MRDRLNSARDLVQRHFLLVAGVVGWFFLAIEGFPPWPDQEELVPLSGRVESHELSDATLHFTIPDSSRVFRVHARSQDNWYEIVEAAELEKEFTLWVGPAVAAGQIWPLSRLDGGVAWQIDADGVPLVSLEAERERRGSNRRFMRVLFLLLSALGYRTWRRRGRAEEQAAPETEELEEELEEDDEADRSVELGAVWCWGILGVGILGLGLWALQRERYQASYPIPERGDLVEHVGEVSDVEVKVSERSERRREREVLSTSFGLKGVQGRWAIYKNLWKYDILARRLVPGARARILVTGSEWERRHGTPPGGEVLWEVEVDDELHLPLDEQLSVVRNRRKNNEHPLVFASLLLVVAACFGNSYRLWRRARR